MTEPSNALQNEIETSLTALEPQVEVLLVEVLPNGTLRIFIDHPDGVSLGLCERVTGHLAELRDRYALEVSSPGQDRPLTKPQHFRRYLGRRARVRLRGDGTRASLPGRASVTGELVGASERDVTIAAPDGVVTIPFDAIVRSNLVPGD